MTKEEAIAILEKYKSWNMGQKSTSLAFDGIRTQEDDIYDARRGLILNATLILFRHSQECVPDQFEKVFKDNFKDLLA